ncbi:MAG: hypothetical protein WD739_09220 [Actinomycetota bacterium]
MHEFAVPSKQRGGLHDENAPALAGHHPRKGREEETISATKPRARTGSLEHHDLLAKSHVLGLEFADQLVR